MKKIFLAIALVAVLAMVFAGCSGKSNGGSSSGNADNGTQSSSQGSGNDSAPDGTQQGGNTNTVEGFLSQLGLTEVDIKPEGAGEGQIIDISSTGNRASITWNMGTTAEQENAWLKKVYDATKALSTDGKVYVDGTDMKNEFIFAPLNRAEWESDMAWVYPYNEKEIGVRCQILGNGSVDVRFIII